jgi:trimeric autotransporter adhesin
VIHARLNERLMAAAAIALLALGCSGKDETSPGDTTSPAAVRDLVAIAPSWDRITLTWTAPGDDGKTGTASRYDIRYSLDPLTDQVWPSAEQASGEPAPRQAGSRDTFVVAGLAPNTTYYFALKTEDDAGNCSAKSNIASAPTIAKPDETAPAAVTDLDAASATTASVTLSWTAPGNDGNTGTAAAYDIRYSTSPIDESSWTWAFQAHGEPAPRPAGTLESFEVTSLASGTTYYFALKTADGTPNWSALSNVAVKTTPVP